MLLQKINELYDLKIYYYNNIIFKEKYIINVLEWYRLPASEFLNVIYYDEGLDQIELKKIEYATVLKSYKRDDTLLTFRDKELIKFEVITERGSDVL